MYKFELFDTPNVILKTEQPISITIDGKAVDANIPSLTDYTGTGTVTWCDTNQWVTSVSTSATQDFATLPVDGTITLCGNVTINGVSISDTVVNELSQLITPEYTSVNLYCQPTCPTHYISASNVRFFSGQSFDAPTYQGRCNEYKLNDVIEGLNSQILLLSFYQTMHNEQIDRQQLLIQKLLKHLNLSEGDLL